MSGTVNVKEVEIIAISDLTESINFELEENVDIALDDFLADIEELGEPVVDGL